MAPISSSRGVFRIRSTGFAMGRSMDATLVHTLRRRRPPPGLHRRAAALYPLLRRVRAMTPRRWAAALEDVATSRGKHPFEEAVLPFARDALRLISTLGHRATVLATAGREGLPKSAAPTLGGTSGELSVVYQRTRQPVEDVSQTGP